MLENDQADIFEDQVRRIAKALWPQVKYQGATFAYNQERDAVFTTDECIHLVEATTSKKRAKAEQDAEKLAKLKRDIRPSSGDKAIQCWFITKQEPTADQRDAINKVTKKSNTAINCLSFVQFQSKLINADNYLDTRDSYFFGSIQDPRQDKKESDLIYIETDITDKNNSKWKISDICKKLIDGSRLLLLGDYGAGKSMTLREVYKRLKNDYFKSNNFKFPVYINLREHQGQQDPEEILDRHAKKIGFEPRSHLVKAWNSGYTYLILDGFDEITTYGIQGKWNKLKDVRYRSMTPIRKFIKQSSPDTGIILAGRVYLFDTETEMISSLCDDIDFTQLKLNDFTEEQIKLYLIKNSISTSVPEWMPSRPLLLGTLILRGILKDIETNNSLQGRAIDPGYGWDMLLDEISKRESKIDIGIDPPTVRNLYDRLATKARETQDGLGSFGQKDLMDIFFDVCQYQADEQALLLLQRLPGLGVDSPTEGTRKFVDEDFCDACRASDIISFILNPYTFNKNIFQGFLYALGKTGMSVSRHKTYTHEITAKQLNASIDSLKSEPNCEYAKFDLINIAKECNFNIGTALTISNVLAHELDLLTSSDLSSVEFSECYFYNLELPPSNIDNLFPHFKQCYIGNLKGRISREDLPNGVFSTNCEIESYSQGTDTVDDILSMPIGIGIKVALTILRKIYTQKGSGRLETALYRGLNTNSIRYVADVLKILHSNCIIDTYQRRGATIWLPIKTQRRRVNRLLSAPSTSGDSLLDILSQL